MRARKLIENNGLDIQVNERRIPIIPPWHIKPIQICKGLNYLNKVNYNPDVMKTHTLEHMRRKINTTNIFTDGSKSSEGVGFAVYSEQDQVSYSLPYTSSIFTAEVMAILYATLTINKSSNSKFTIYTDSRSAIDALDQYEHKCSLVQKTKIMIHKLKEKGKEVQLCWIPSHIGIRGNEIADSMAKKAITKPRCNEPIPLLDHMNKIKQIISQKWQKRWDEVTNNKLKEIKETTKEWSTSIQKDRQTESILTRLRIGHTKLTHGYLMNIPRDPAPSCNECNVTLTIKHIFSNCKKFSNEKTQCFENRSFNEIFQEGNTFAIHKIIEFLKKTKMIDEI